MDHTDAVRSNAAERYAIGDLPVAEVEEFERHFFECPHCSEELRTLSILVANARAVLAEPPVVATPTAPVSPAVVPPAAAPEPRVVDKVRAWWREPWVLGPAFAALAVIVFLSATPQLRQPSAPSSAKIEQIPSFPLFAAARGEETVVNPSAAAPSFTLYLDKTWEGSDDSYRAVIRDEANNTERAAFTLKDPGSGRFLQISVPARALSPGRYVLVIQSPDKDKDKDKDLARYPFTLVVN